MDPECQVIQEWRDLGYQDLQVTKEWRLRGCLDQEVYPQDILAINMEPTP